MNVLVIDDDNSKIRKLIEDIHKIDPEAKIRFFNNYSDSIRFIEDNKNYLDYIILDWSFPLRSYERCRYGMGHQILEEMKHSHIFINTIICSSDIVYLNLNEFPFVIGSILYSNNTDVLAQFRTMIVPKDPEMVKVSRAKKCINKPDQSKYQRKKSSTPWWMR